MGQEKKLLVQQELYSRAVTFRECKDPIARSALAGSSVCGGEEGAMNSRELQKELKLH